MNLKDVYTQNNCESLSEATEKEERVSERLKTLVKKHTFKKNANNCTQFKTLTSNRELP